jgi:hypothetical protein
MTIPELVKRFEQLAREMEQERAWGSIEVRFQNGQAETIRKDKTEKLNMGATRVYETR